MRGGLLGDGFYRRNASAGVSERSISADISDMLQSLASFRFSICNWELKKFYLWEEVFVKRRSFVGGEGIFLSTFSDAGSVPHPVCEAPALAGGEPPRAYQKCRKFLYRSEHQRRFQKT